MDFHRHGRHGLRIDTAHLSISKIIPQRAIIRMLQTVSAAMVHAQISNIPDLKYASDSWPAGPPRKDACARNPGAPHGTHCVISVPLTAPSVNLPASPSTSPQTSPPTSPRPLKSPPISPPARPPTRPPTSPPKSPPTSPRPLKSPPTSPPARPPTRPPTSPPTPPLTRPSTHSPKKTTKQPIVTTAQILLSVLRRHFLPGPPSSIPGYLPTPPPPPLRPLCNNAATTTLSRRPDHGTPRHFTPQLGTLARTNFYSDSDVLTGISDAYAHKPTTHRADAFTQDGNLWYHTCPDGARRFCIPNDAALRRRLLHEAHDVPLAGHLSIKQTLARLRCRFYWPNLNADAHRNIRTCLRHLPTPQKLSTSPPAASSTLCRIPL